MRILLANPNTSQAVTDRIAAVARPAASPGTTIQAVTAAVGVPYIATRAEAVIGARAVLELFAEHAEGADAAIQAWAPRASCCPFPSWAWRRRRC